MGEYSSISDPASERAVLAGIFKGGTKSYYEVCDLVTERSFLLEENKILFGIARQILEDKGERSSLDLPDIMVGAKDLGVNDFLLKEDDKKYLRAILNFPIKQEALRGFAQRIAKLHISRQYGEALELSKEQLYSVTGKESLSEIISLVEGPIVDHTTKLSSTNQDGPKLIKDYAGDYFQRLLDKENERVGLSTGFPLFDKMIGGGLRRKYCSVIVARMKHYKSGMLGLIALYLARQNTPVFLLDTEMDPNDLMNRWWASISGEKIEDIESGRFKRDDLSLQRVLSAKSITDSIPFYFQSVAGKSAQEVSAIMRRWILREVGFDENGKTKDCLVIYDYVKLTGYDNLKTTNESQSMGLMLTEFNTVANNLDFPVLTACQANRQALDDDDTSIVFGSDRIAQYAANVNFLKRKTAEEMLEDGGYQNGTHKIRSLVCRHGTGDIDEGDYLNLKTDLSRGRIWEGQLKSRLASAQNQEQSLGGEIKEDGRPVIPQF